MSKNWYVGVVFYCSVKWKYHKTEEDINYAKVIS